MDKEDQINQFISSLTFITNNLLSTYIEKKSQPFKLLLNKPIITKYINKIIFSNTLKSDEEIIKNNILLENLKKKIFEHINSTDKQLVLNEILFYKHQKPLFKFIDIRKQNINVYKINTEYKYFLQDIFLDKSNYNIINISISELINNILNNEYNIIDANYELTKDSISIYGKKEDINLIENNEENINIFYEIYNLKKDKILYICLLINLCLKYKIIKYNVYNNIILHMVEKIKNLFKNNNNFIIEQEIILISYILILLKCIFLNTQKNFLKNKIITQNDVINFKKIYSNSLLKKIYEIKHNTYLKFLLIK